MELYGGYATEAPSIQVRWLRPTTSTALLQLPTTPITVNHINTWVALSAEESLKCEIAWNDLSKDEQAIALESSRDNNKTTANDAAIEESDSEDETVGVTIFQDRLFEVDVRSMESGLKLTSYQLKPIYWKSNGPKIHVRRATWMYDEVSHSSTSFRRITLIPETQTRPVHNDLCEQLDTAYRLIRPWQESYQLELEAARKVGIEGYDKLKYPVTSSEGGDSPKDASRVFVVFEDAFTAILTTGGTTSFTSSIFSTKSSLQSKILPFLGITVYYGYDSALAARESKSKKSSPRNSLDKDSEDTCINAVEIPSTATDKMLPMPSSERINTKLPNSVGDSGPKKVTDLVLIVHGIGQALALQYESWSFLYAVNLFRQIARKQSALPSLASILREKQVQFLPVEWRARLKLGEDEQREREREGLDNSFTVADITPKKSISAIREVTNNVLIDIPYFMSRHQKAMIESLSRDREGLEQRVLQVMKLAAKNMPPSILPTFNESVISGLSNRFSRILEDVMPRSFAPSSPRSRMNSPVRPGAKTVPSTFELQGHNESLQGSRAERRFSALNPHGTVDFQLASEGSISEYVEIIESILLFATPSTVGAFSQTCKTYYSLIYSHQDNHFWRNFFLAQGIYDDPRLNFEQKNSMIRWDKLVQNWVAAAKVLLGRRSITSVDTIRGLLDLVDYSRPGPESSLNLLHFEKLIEECDGISTLLSNFIENETDVASERTQLVHRLKVYIGLAAHKTPEARLEARCYIYNLQNYTKATSYGPFLPDKSGRVNWVHLFRAQEILVMNAMDFVNNHQSLLPCTMHDLQQWGTPDTIKDERDWAGITGKWQVIFSFCDHRDLMAFNDPFTYPRRATNIFEAEDFEEAFRVIDFDFTVSGVSHEDDAWSTRPTLHFIGRMGDAHRITGRVYVGPDGHVNWSFVSGEGVPMWSIQVVQIGGVGSTYGALGTWTTVAHDLDDPVG
ncbi:hypothetical protein Clacol_009883 [Clathrus columnatus]|uniref:DDHD domain-containing protein n=1 Tax=Clathrus columnatus TaxID=1419009 RepID=A0AAV5AS86_9AGAM|nr:hypothetical protein Clacol_009883 [Clathrus columnatus]